MIHHLGLARDAREILGERCLGWRYGDLFQNLAALRLDRFGEEIAMIMSKGKIGKDHRDLLAQIVGHKRRHCDHLAFHIGDPRLHRVPV